MRTRVAAATCTGVMFLVAGDGSAQDVATRDELERVKESLVATIAENTSNVDAFDANGFHAVSSENQQLGADFKPDGQQFQQFEVSAPDVFRVAIEKGRPSSTGGSVVG